MRNDHPACASLRRQLGDPPPDILIRQAVKTVAPHTLVVEMHRQCEELGLERLGAMKGGIEAGHLRQVGVQGEQ